jgi:uncharacterized cupredoxin-like copper-binding protein
MAEGISKLARVISARIGKERDANSDLVIDFGVIEKDKGLTTDTFPVTIPQSDYFVIEGQSIEPGDSVLVAWVFDDAIVIGKVQSATEGDEDDG